MTNVLPRFHSSEKIFKTKKGWEKSEDGEEAETIQRNLGKNKRKDQMQSWKTWNLAVTNVLPRFHSSEKISKTKKRWEKSEDGEEAETIQDITIFIIFHSYLEQNHSDWNLIMNTILKISRTPS